MERILKFRAWDKDDSRMYLDVMIGRSGNYIAYEYTTETDKDEDGEDCDFEVTYACFDNTKQNTVVMQCTGLVDANKEEIYEGDILSSTNDSALLKWLVVFQNGCFGIRNIGLGGYMNHNEFHRIDGRYYFEGRKIVGDIYQNPEWTTDQGKNDERSVAPEAQ